MLIINVIKIINYPLVEIYINYTQHYQIHCQLIANAKPLDIMRNIFSSLNIFTIIFIIKLNNYLRYQ